MPHLQQPLFDEEEPGGRWEEIQRLFDEIVELDASARAGKLEALERQDPAIRSAVLSLLDAFDAAGDFMDLLKSEPAPAAQPAPAPAASRVGSRVGAYRIEREIGRGGMGEVYLARDERLGRAVALKFLSPHLNASSEARERLHAEARAAASLDHPNVATIFEIGEHQGGAFIAMAFYDGETLKDRIARGPLPVEEALDIAAQVAAGLAAAHRKGIVHRDIKPSNILLLSEGPVKITDFGIARTLEQDLTSTGQRLGTPAYMAPEQIEGEPAGPRADLWSLGAVLYEMLSGRKAFPAGSDAGLAHAILHGEPPPLDGLRADLPSGLDALVRRALAKQPAGRHPSADELLADLRRLRLPGGAAPEARLPPPQEAAGAERAGWPPNLPHHLSELIGRGRELQQVRDLILRKGCRLLTLTGPGGTGKTRLAACVAAELAPAFPGRICFVALAAVPHATLVPSAAARALGIRETAGDSVGDRLVGFIGEARGLLVFDNFEHVTDAAGFVADLLARCPGLSVLVTSRSPIHILGEREFPVPPLALPEAEELNPKRLQRVPAVALFAARGQAVNPAFAVTDGNAAAVAEICSRLDGLPLAIELAAARVKVLSPRALLARLQDRFDVLESESRDRPARHRTLREALAWSYDLLNGPEQALFRRLGIFAGGCSLEAAEGIADPEVRSRGDVLRILTSLVDKSLLKHEEDPGDGCRFTMLETIREYALERLRQAGDEEEVRRLHLDFFLSFAEEAAQQLTGPDVVLWLDRLEREHNNLRAAFSVALAEDGEAAARIAAALCRFWLARGYVSEGYERSTGILAIFGDNLPPALRAHLLTEAAMLASGAVLFPAAASMLREALALLRPAGPSPALGEALNHLSWSLLSTGDHAAAQESAQEALEIYGALSHHRGVSVALNNLGFSTFLQGDYGAAAAYFEESVAFARRAGDPRGLQRALSNLGYAYFHQGDLAKGEAMQREMALAAEEVRDPIGGAIIRNRLVLVRFERGEREGAAELLRGTLPLFRASGFSWGLMACLNIAGHVLLHAGDCAQAHAVDGELLELGRKIGCKPAIALVLCRRGELRLVEGNVDGAEQAFRESLRLRRDMEERAGTAECLEGLARIALERGEARRAAVLAGAADAIREAAVAPRLPTGAASHRTFMRRLSAAISDDVRSEALDEGRRKSLREAADYGLA